MNKFKERLARRLYECQFEEGWGDLHPHGIERAMWTGMAQAAIEMCEAELVPTARGGGGGNNG